MSATVNQNTSTAGTRSIGPVVSLYYLLAGISAADVLTDFVVPFNFELLDVRFAMSTAVTTGSKAATLTAKIDGTAVAGASISLTSAACTPQGKIITATATKNLDGGNNLGVAGGKISVTASSVTTFSEGAGTLIINVRNLDI